jgi:hypothetical protein
MEITKIGNYYYFGEYKLDCVFYEEAHEYWLGYWQDNDEFERVKKLISVTQLMKKYDLIKGYGNIPKSILNKKAEYGSLVHREIDEYIKKGQVGFSKEVGEFIKFCNTYDLKPIKSEFLVYNDVCAGTVDLMAEYNGFKVRLDNKTTATYDGEYLSWQLSIYDYLDNEKCDKLACLWFKDGLQYKDVDFKRLEEIEKIMEAERSGGSYVIETIKIEDECCLDLITVNSALIELEKRKKILEAKEELIKQKLIEKMEEKGITKFENEYFTLTYVKGNDKINLDTAKIKIEMPEIYEKFGKVVKSKPSLRIKIKGE